MDQNTNHIDSNLTILIIEDNKSYMDITKEMLSEHRCLCAFSASEGLKMYKKYKPNIVFLDISLPDGNGHELLMEIKHYDKNAFVIMLTSSQLKEDVLSSIEQGANDYIIKPLSRAKIKKTYEKYFELVKL